MILFEVECAAPPGESVAVLGSGPLGGWDLGRALVLESERPGVWSGQIQGALSSGVEFRYALIDARGPSPKLVRWEAQGRSRTADPKARYAELLILRHRFGDLVGGSVEVVRSNSRPSSECCDASTDVSTEVPEASPAPSTFGCEVGGTPAAAMPDAQDLVLHTLQVDASIRFGRFFHEPGAFEDKYELDAKTVLGSGMSGGVCLARYRATGMQIAVKTLSTVDLAGDKLRRVMAEVENQLMMDHPNICRLLEVFEEQGRLRLVMERMRGPDLFDHLARKGRYTERDASGCVRQMTAAVAYCHRNGVCHRDLKLENFCLEDDSEDARVKLIDFGLSSVFQSSAPMTNACGSLYYVAPEVLKLSYDKKCDVWSLGVITYILLDGRPPFNGKDDRATYLMIKKGEVDFPSERWYHISNRAVDFVTTLLQVDVARRPDAEAALALPWLAEFVTGADGEDLRPLDATVLDSMRRFSKSNALKRAVLRAITPVATVERVALWADHFEALDQDGDGKVSIHDLARRLVDHGGLSKNEAAQLSVVLAESDEGGDLVSYSAFLAACLSAHVTWDDRQLRSLFNRLDRNQSGMVSFEDVHKALGDVVDVESLQAEFAGRELTYSDFRWLMSMPGLGPTILGLRQLLGASSSLESSWKSSTKRAKRVADESAALEAARRENMAWRVMSMNSKRGKDRGGEAAAAPGADSSTPSPGATPDLAAAQDPEPHTKRGEDLAPACCDPMRAVRFQLDESDASSSEEAGPGGVSSVLASFNGDEDELNAWQCATVAAKDGCVTSVRLENMLWRRMYLQSSKK